MIPQLQANRIPVNGVNLAYVEHGTGIPVVFVHGGLGDYRSWTFQMAPFAGNPLTTPRLFEPSAEKARAAGWQLRELPAGHLAMLNCAGLDWKMSTSVQRCLLWSRVLLSRKCGAAKPVIDADGDDRAARHNCARANS